MAAFALALSAGAGAPETEAREVGHEPMKDISPKRRKPSCGNEGWKAG